MNKRWILIVVWLVMFSLMLTSCSSKVSVKGKWWEKNEGHIVEFLEEGKGVWGGTNFTYELIEDDEIIRASNLFYTKEFEIVLLTKDEMILRWEDELYDMERYIPEVQDKTQEISEYIDLIDSPEEIIPEENSLSDNDISAAIDSPDTPLVDETPSDPNLSTVDDIPTIIEAKVGDMIPLGGGSLFIAGWQWVGDECETLSNPPNQAGRLLVEFYSVDEGLDGVHTSLSNMYVRFDEGEDLQFKQAFQIFVTPDKQTFNGGNYCTEILGHDSRLITTDLPWMEFSNNGSVFWVVSYRSDEGKLPRPYNQENIYIDVYSTDEFGGEKTSRISLSLDGDPEYAPLPPEYDEIASLEKKIDFDGKNKTYSISGTVTPAYAYDAWQDTTRVGPAVSYFFDIEVENITDVIIDTPQTVMVIDQFGDNYIGSLSDSVLLAPGEKRTVKGEVIVPAFVAQGRLVAVFNSDSDIEDLAVIELDSFWGEVVPSEVYNGSIPKFRPHIISFFDYLTYPDSSPSVISSSVEPSSTELPAYYDCSSFYPRLAQGGYQYGSVSPGGQPNRLRNGPGLDFGYSKVINSGVVFEILEDPVCADDLLWYHIKSINGTEFDGWMAESTPSDGYVMVPCPDEATCFSE